MYTELVVRSRSISVSERLIVHVTRNIGDLKKIVEEEMNKRGITLEFISCVSLCMWFQWKDIKFFKI